MMVKTKKTLGSATGKLVARAEVRLRPATARLTCRLLASLVDTGLVTSGELLIIRKNLNSIAKTGELAPVIAPRLLTGSGAAEMLNVSYSQSRQLEKEGAFPFKRKMIGGKTVRFLNTEILDYMLIGSRQGEVADAGGGDDA